VNHKPCLRRGFVFYLVFAPRNPPVRHSPDSSEGVRNGTSARGMVGREQNCAG
jgi:hypothetical protein